MSIAHPPLIRAIIDRAEVGEMSGMRANEIDLKARAGRSLRRDPE
jgi:hypothetical protein